eukprot:scaffold164380_cov19-Tisochrysis_lutea.AAC.1
MAGGSIPRSLIYFEIMCKGVSRRGFQCQHGQSMLEAIRMGCLHSHSQHKNRRAPKAACGHQSWYWSWPGPILLQYGHKGENGPAEVSRKKGRNFWV